MGKKIRYQYLRGALIQPFLQFVGKVQFGINPISDPKGSKMAEHMFKFAGETRPRFKGEKFQQTINYDLTSNSSWVIFHYLNGMQNGFHLKKIDMLIFSENHKYMSMLTEFDRACQGHEDEYEDQDKL